MSWLPKEILDHLDHAGYVAVPKDRIDTVTAQVFTDAISVMSSNVDYERFQAYQADHLARLIARELLKKGFIAIEECTADENGNISTRATLTALRPRLVASSPRLIEEGGQWIINKKINKTSENEQSKNEPTEGSSVT